MSDVESDFEELVGATSVLLGFAGREASLADISVSTNHIGGSPVWLSGHAPAEDLVRCQVCNKDLDLLTQLSCPLPDKYYDRVLYVFACSEPNCRRKRGSIRALRGIESNADVRDRIKREIAEAQPENNVFPPQGDIGDRLFSTSDNMSNPFAGPNPFGGGGGPLAQPTTTSNASQKTKQKARSKRDNIIVPGRYSCRLMDVEEEYIEPENTSAYAGVKVEDAEEGGSDAVDIKEIKEIEAKEDPIFSKFVTMVEHNPEQILRYERGLAPLLYSGEDSVAQEIADLGTQGKMLEVQLMPHLITELETDDMLADGMEWGSIFIATAANDALPTLDNAGVGYVEELVAVQWEG